MNIIVIHTSSFSRLMGLCMIKRTQNSRLRQQDLREKAAEVQFRYSKPSASLPGTAYKQQQGCSLVDAGFGSKADETFPAPAALPCLLAALSLILDGALALW